MATVEAQTAGAFTGDIGITSSLSPHQDCTRRPDRLPGRSRPVATPEVDDAKLDRVVFYNRTLAVPARRDVGDADHVRGRAAVQLGWVAPPATPGR